MTRSVGQHKMDFIFSCMLFVLFCYVCLVGVFVYFYFIRRLFLFCTCYCFEKGRERDMKFGEKGRWGYLGGVGGGERIQLKCSVGKNLK